MNITIVAPDSFGYIDFLFERLQQYPMVQVTFVNYSGFKYKYTSKFEKVKNALNKLIFKKNIKAIYKSECLLSAISELGKQDVILVIRPDKIQFETLVELKRHTKKLYSYYFDSIANFPDKIDVIPLFDKVFSYEKQDVKKFNLTFLTNYIYDIDPQNNTSHTQHVFNISSFDNRFEILKKIAAYMKSETIDYKILVRKERVYKDELVTIIPDYLPLEAVKKHVLATGVLLDIQKKNQKGLSFRVFEALGYNKKLITTNTDIVNYDFYNASNILVIDVNNIQIPKSFLSTPYVIIPSAILFPYTLEGWIKKVFSLSLQAPLID